MEHRLYFVFSGLVGYYNRYVFFSHCATVTLEMCLNIVSGLVMVQTGEVPVDYLPHYMFVNNTNVNRSVTCKYVFVFIKYLHACREYRHLWLT